MKARALLTAALLVIGAASARAAEGRVANAAGDVVTLKDGSSLRGAVVGQSADAVELATPEGPLHVGRERIARIDYADGAAAPATAAAPPARKSMFSLGLGFVEPLGHVDFRPIGGGSADDGDLGAQFSAQYFYFVSPRLGLGGSVEYFDRAGTISARLLPGATSSVGGQTWLGLGLLRRSLVDRGTARPFVLLGGGGAWNTTTIDAFEGAWPDNGARETRRLVDDGVFAPAAAVRVGVDVDAEAFRPGALTFEAGWTWIDSARYAATPAGQKLGVSRVSGPLNLITFTARYGWKF